MNAYQHSIVLNYLLLSFLVLNSIVSGIFNHVISNKLDQYNSFEEKEHAIERSNQHLFIAFAVFIILFVFFCLYRCPLVWISVNEQTHKRLIIDGLLFPFIICIYIVIQIPYTLYKIFIGNYSSSNISKIRNREILRYFYINDDKSIELLNGRSNNPAFPKLRLFTLPSYTYPVIIWINFYFLNFALLVINILQIQRKGEILFFVF